MRSRRTFSRVTPLGAAVRLEVEHTTRNHGDEVHIWICGELDLATRDDLQAGLADIPLDAASVVRLNLSGLTFCDARGANLLLLYLQQASDRRLVATIDSPTRAVRRILQLIDPDLLEIGPGVSKRRADCTPDELQAADEYAGVLIARDLAAAERMEAGQMPACDYQYPDGSWCDNDAMFFLMPVNAEQADALEHIALCSEHRLT
jgi:anti-anti-sigma factor